MSCKNCNTNCIEAGTRDDQMCSAWTKRDDADMGNYFAKLAKVQTNIRTAMEKQTNADRIRSMTDEELAEWIERIRMLCENEACGMACPLIDICYPKTVEPTETLDWLKQEAE